MRTDHPTPALELLEGRTLLASVSPAGFAAELVVSGLSNPTAMEFAPDGRVFVSQQGGSLRVIKNGSLLATPFLSLTVDSAGERGLLGIAFDPNFAANRFVYVYYTVPAPTGGAAHNRVSRFTASAANPDVVTAGSELPILDLDNLSNATNHNGGAIHFGPDGKLYVAVGENANGANAQTLSNRLGKMLRINSDGSIPTDNPFFNTASGANRAIWALGLRNPFTFAFQPGTTTMYINDVGNVTWEEINVGQAGKNYGWPTIEGTRTTQTPPANYVDPLFTYRHPQTGSDPLLTGIAITGGSFYVRPAAPVVSPFPDDYAGDYFFADLGNNWIRKLEAGTANAVPFLTGGSTIVDIKEGPDGALYYLERGNSGALQRVRYTVAVPTGVDLAPTSDTGVSDTDNLTNDDTPTIAGAAPGGSVVHVFSDGIDVGSATATAGGAYSITTSPLSSGTHVITATATVGGNASASSLPLSITIDRTPPAVTLARFDYTPAQRVRLQFSEDVRQTLDAPDLTTAPQQTFTVTLSGAPGQSTTADFTPTAILPDGNYHATLASGAVADAAGNEVAAWPGLDFFVYGGDATGDRTVDFADLVPLAQNYNTAGKTYDQGDFDYDGDVDFADLVILAHHYNTTLPPPAAPAPAVATSPVQNSRRSPTAEPSALVFSTKPVAKPASKPRLVSKPPRR